MASDRERAYPERHQLIPEPEDLELTLEQALDVLRRDLEEKRKLLPRSVDAGRVTPRKAGVILAGLELCLSTLEQAAAEQAEAAEAEERLREAAEEHDREYREAAELERDLELEELELEELDLGPEMDADGNCARCGLLLTPEERSGEVIHDCPDGFRI